MAQKKQVSRLKDLKKSKKCSQYQMYDSRLKNISIKDTNDSKYKRIRRLSHKPVVSEDTDPE